MAPRTVPIASTRALHDLISGGIWNAGVKSVGDFMLAPPLFRGRQTVTQTMVNATFAPLSLTTSDVDTESGHSNVTNPSRYVAQVAGWYWVEGYFALAAGTISRFVTAIAKNGSTVAGSAQIALRVNDLQSLSASTTLQLAVGDYVEVWGEQSSGGSISTFDGTDLACCLNVFWIHS